MIDMIKTEALYRRKNNPEETFLAYEIQTTYLTGGKEKITVSGFLKNGESKSYTKEYLLKNFIIDLPDYGPMKEHIVQYSDQVPAVKKLFRQLCRRFHPGGYFHVGDLVYGTDSIGYYSTDTRYDRLIELPLKIIDIQSMPSSTAKIIVLESKYGTIETQRVCIPMYQDRYSEIDAYACLRRYDMPY